MTRPALPFVLTALMALAMLAAPLSLAAQDRPARELRIVMPDALQRGTSPGWLGMQIAAIREERTGQPDVAEWRIEGVVEGSPAAEAGIREGDRLVAVDGAAASDEVLDQLTTELQPGAEVRIRVERDGETLDFVMTAAERPALILTRPSGQVHIIRRDSLLRLPRDLEIRLDSVAAHFDSLAYAFEAPHLRFGVPRADSIRLHAMPIDSMIRLQPFAFDSAMRVRAFSVDSIARFHFRGDSARWPAGDIRIERFGGSAPYVEVSPWGLAWSGRDAVAGVRLTEVNPDLGSYFGVERGLLVTELIEDGPGERAGMRAGDVIVAVEGEAVRSIEELRRALTTALRSPPVSLEVVRQRESLFLELPGQER